MLNDTNVPLHDHCKQLQHRLKTEEKGERLAQAPVTYLTGGQRQTIVKRGEELSETAGHSFLCASMAIGAYAITLASSAFLAYTRSVCAAYFCGAALCCALSVKVIKKFVKQPRPLGVTQLKSYGYELHYSLSLRPLLPHESEILYLSVLLVCLALTRPSCSSTLARWFLRPLRCPSTLRSQITYACVCGPQ